MINVSPVFAKSTVGGVSEINGREFKTYEQALTFARKDKSMQTLLSLCIARNEALGANKAIAVPEIDSPQWEFYVCASIGEECLIRARAKEQIRYSMLGLETTIEPGTISGWILVTPQNIKALKDRTLYIDEKSLLFGEAAGRNVIVGSEVSGNLRDCMVYESNVGYCELNGVTLRESRVEFSKMNNSRILHSFVGRSTVAHSLISSSEMHSCTAVRSQLTDVNATFVGAQDSTLCSVKAHGCKFSDRKEVGVGTKTELENIVDQPMWSTLLKSLVKAERAVAFDQLRVSMDKAVVETGKALRGGEWQVEAKDGKIEAARKGRVELDVTGEGGQISSAPATGVLMNQQDKPKGDDDLDDLDDMPDDDQEDSPAAKVEDKQ